MDMKEQLQELRFKDQIWNVLGVITLNSGSFLFLKNASNLINLDMYKVKGLSKYFKDEVFKSTESEIFLSDYITNKLKTLDLELKELKNILIHFNDVIIKGEILNNLKELDENPNKLLKNKDNLIEYFDSYFNLDKYNNEAREELNNSSNENEVKEELNISSNENEARDELNNSSNESEIREELNISNSESEIREELNISNNENETREELNTSNNENEIREELNISNNENEIREELNTSNNESEVREELNSNIKEQDLSFDSEDNNLKTKSNDKFNVVLNLIIIALIISLLAILYFKLYA